jgi:hypothetical protein
VRLPDSLEVEVAKKRVNGEEGKLKRIRVTERDWCE